jgi:hypothetical protein
MKVSVLVDDLAKHFEEVASENARLAIASPGDLRLAINAIMTFDGFFGSLHAVLHQQGKVSETDDRWKEKLAGENDSYRLLRDSAYALKHGALTRAWPRRVRRADNILSMPGAFGLGFQPDAFHVDMVWIGAEDTDYQAYKVIKEVAEFAREILSRFL